MSKVLIILFCFASIALGERIYEEDVCRNSDRTLMASATDCYNIYNDYTCEELFPHNDPMNSMGVGNKNPRSFQCSMPLNTTAQHLEDHIELDATFLCPRRCGYCCKDVLKTYFNFAIDCEGLSSFLCQDSVFGNLLKRACPVKCAAYIAMDKLTAEY